MIAKLIPYKTCSYNRLQVQWVKKESGNYLDYLIYNGESYDTKG